jgi:hypothetical protein
MYEIRLKGHLDSRWAAWFDGLSLANESDGTTLISGPVADQAALHGLLQRVRDLGLPLISVTHVEVLPSPSAKEIAMDSLRKTALAAGVLYLVTFVSIPTLALYRPVRDPDYIVGPGPGTGVIWGVVLEMIVALACIGTAVVLYPVVKRQNESLALGFVAARTLEAATIVAGVVILMSMVTLRAAGAGPEALVTGKALAAMHDWTFLLGQGFLPAVNALLLGSLMYQSRLVPRILPLLGLIGAPLLATAAAGTLFGVWDQVSPLSGLLTLPIAVWELSLGVWLVVKGFKPSPITAGTVAAESRPAYRDEISV